MKQFDDLYDIMEDQEKKLLTIKRKLWLFEWFLFFLMVYMCYIAYKLYELNVEIVGSMQILTPSTKILFT